MQLLENLNLLINAPVAQFVKELPVVVDCETDENDNFVGIGATQNGTDIYYWTKLPKDIEQFKLIGHELKGDLHWLKKWGVPVSSDNIYMDTIIMSFVHNPTRLKHGLKALAKELLGHERETYKDIVGKGKKKLTLDKQPIQRVAEYCGNDVLDTWNLYQWFSQRLTLEQKKLLNEIEMPMNRLLFKMEEKGIELDLEYLKTLQPIYHKELDDIRQRVWDYCETEFNLDSTKQLGEVLLNLGAKLPKTATGKPQVDKKALERNSDIPIVKDLIEYGSLSTITSTFIDGLINRNETRLHTDFNQIINTGRLSSRNPNLQNIPVKGTRGDDIRKAFVAAKGNVLVDFDYSQIEYRLLAHLTKEPALIEAYKNGRDIHEETAKIIGVDRYVGKTLNFAAIYGANAKRIVVTVNSASETKITERDAESFLNLYWYKLPRVKNWINGIKALAHSKKTFQTMSGQTFGLHGIDSDTPWQRWHAERQAVNGTIQGSAAYIMKLAMLELEKRGYVAVLQIHDELIFETDEMEDCDPIRPIMQNAVKLDVPLVVECGSGRTWHDAKGK